ncbi:F-box only protein 42-like, partial [Stegodyphus dumicola]|uniref:F-box only protein 42-like n=1 Tax=Stegodyphus dumicola TaxID=202533 RepID=UPI0015B0E716
SVLETKIVMEHLVTSKLEYGRSRTAERKSYHPKNPELSWDIAIDKNHLLIIGGCGGPNKLYTDIWLLKMSSDLNVVWEWQEMCVRMKENGAPHLAFHPACKVGSQVAVMSKTQRSRTSPSSLPHLLRAPSRIWVPPRINMENGIDVKISKRPPPEIEPCVNGKRGVLKRHIDRQNNSTSSHMSSSDEDDFHSQDLAKRKSSNLGLNSGARSSRDNSKTFLVSSVNSPSTSGYQNTAAKNSVSSSYTASGQISNSDSKGNVDNTSSSHNSRDASVQNSQKHPPLNPYASRRNRQRQLEGLDRMEQRLRDLRAGTLSFPMVSSKVFQKHTCSHIVTAKNPMCLYVLDISTASSEGYVTWRMLKNQSPSAPEEVILHSLVLRKGELIMFGGIQKDLNSRQQEGETVHEVVSNSLHFMTAEHFVI